ncbi:MAG: YidC/Oxa1 family membrane protein insertase [bacterium]|nr:YidC/Oxa1 family membrane protein insertase [bacterium]
MDFILNPFVTLLTFLYRVFGNDMVLSIAVFTVLVRLLTLPLTLQQQRSTRAMQQIQPEMRRLQEKYKNDREKLAAEQMTLYREYGINPLGGCLPLLIQFPIFIALYQAINMALAATPTQMIDTAGRLLVPGLDSVIPLNNRWLGMDLTQPPNLNTVGTSIESFFPIILLGLVGITTWLQFKMTMPKPAAPSPDGKPDQAQAMTQSMGTIMPIMYVFFSLSFSVGLSIYFIVSNVVGIAQYAVLNRNKLPATPAEIVDKAAEKPADKALPAKGSAGSGASAAVKNVRPNTAAGKPSGNKPNGKPTAKASKAK